MPHGLMDHESYSMTTVSLVLQSYLLQMRHHGAVLPDISETIVFKRMYMQIKTQTEFWIQIAADEVPWESMLKKMPSMHMSGIVSSCYPMQ